MKIQIFAKDSNQILSCWSNASDNQNWILVMGIKYLSKGNLNCALTSWTRNYMFILILKNNNQPPDKNIFCPLESSCTITFFSFYR